MSAWALPRRANPVLVAAATNIGPWDLGLRQPSWKPPDILFGPVWTVAYALTACAGVLNLAVVRLNAPFGAS